MKQRSMQHNSPNTHIHTRLIPIHILATSILIINVRHPMPTLDGQGKLGMVKWPDQADF